MKMMLWSLNDIVRIAEQLIARLDAIISNETDREAYKRLKAEALHAEADKHSNEAKAAEKLKAKVQTLLT
jgi:hypothetical protein